MTDRTVTRKWRTGGTWLALLLATLANFAALAQAGAPRAAGASSGTQAAPAPAPSSADMIVLLNVQGMESHGLVLTKSLDGQLKIKETLVGKRPVAGQAMIDDIFNGNAQAGSRRQYYASQDPELLEGLWQQAKASIAAMGLPGGELQWDGNQPLVKNIGGELKTGNLLPPFGVHPRADLPNLKGLIDRGDLVVLGEVSVFAVLNDIRAEKQRVADLKRRTEDRTQNLLLRLPTFGDSLVSLVLPPPKGDDNKPVERRYCSLNARAEMAEWTIGFRYLEQLNKGLNTKRQALFDELAQSLDELYDLVQTGKCQILIVSNDHAAKLASAMQRDKISFNVYIIIPKAKLLASYAEYKGYSSAEKYQLAQQLVPNATVTPKGLERLEKFGVSSAGEFNAAVERMSKGKYATERTSDNVLSFLADEKEGQASKLTALQVREGREKKAATERKAQEEAERARRVAYAREYPYYAIISCGMPEHMSILACFSGSHGVDTELKIKNGGNSQMYKVYNLHEAGREERDGLHIDLKQHFTIAAQNSSDSLILTVKIYDRLTNKVVYNDQAAKFRVVKVDN